MTKFARLPRRPWTSDEQLFVQRGFAGRILIAVEPLLCSIVFIVLTIAPFYATASNDALLQKQGLIQFTLAQVLAPIMAFGAVSFAVYAVVLLLKPTRALISTFEPIYIVDGYLEYRTIAQTNGRRRTHVAILDHDNCSLKAWFAASPLAIHDGVYPALIEFSRYGGILKIDGKPLEPPLFALAPFGVGSFNAHITTTKTNNVK